MGRRTKEVARLVTDGQGAFSYVPMEPGEYSISYAKPGYSRSSASAVRVSVNAEHPQQQLRFVLERRGTIFGRFVDAATREAVSGFSFSFRAYSVEMGERKLGNTITAKADEDGAFTISLAPGRYLIETRPQQWTNRVLTSFADEDAEKVDEDYGHAFLPGGSDLDAALPLTLNSGGLIELGDLVLRKETLHRVRVRIGGECSSDDQVEVLDFVGAIGTRARTGVGRIRCGAEALVRGIEPGPHRFEAQLMLGSRRGTAIVEVRRNRAIALNLDRGAEITSRVFVSEGAGPAPLEQVRVSLAPLDAVSLLPVPYRLKDGSNPTIPRGRMLLSVTGLAEQFYIKQIRYNGAAAAGGLIDHQNSAFLEVEIDSQAATISGTVRFQDKGVADAGLALMRSADVPGGITAVRAGANGTFRIAGLAPGEYRIFAARPDQWERAQEPGVWQGLIASAQRVVLSRGEVRSVDLKTVNIQ